LGIYEGFNTIDIGYADVWGGCMKWSEFKEQVERQLKDQGEEDPDIWYIDCTVICDDEVTVHVDAADGMTITN
jgi:hypothetical protein